MTHYDGRQIDLKNRINKHLSKLTGLDLDFYARMSQSDLVELKTVFADINNILTFKTTIAATNWICSFFEFDTDVRKHILDTVDQTKPNTKGFDIHILKPYEIIGEVKCTSPVNNGGKFGSAQWNSILDDFYNLKNGKGTLLDTSKYFKFMFLLDLGDRTDQAITQLLRVSSGTSEKPLRANRHQIKQHISLLTDTEKLADLHLDRVYLKKIQIDL